MISEKVCLEVMEAMKTAGARMLDAHPGRNEVHKKEGRANFVTDYDVANQRFLETAFREILPDATFLGEENTGRERVRSLPDGLLWIVDPIDGTTNFMYGYDFSTISVGLALDGRMEAGFVFNPYRQDMYHAVRGQGAFRNGECLSPLTGGVEDGIVAFGCACFRHCRCCITEHRRSEAEAQLPGTWPGLPAAAMVYTWRCCSSPGTMLRQV